MVTYNDELSEIPYVFQIGTFCFSVFFNPIEFLNKTFKFSEFTSKWVIDGNMDGNMDGNALEKTKQKQIKNRSETEQDQNRNRTETEQIQTGQRARLFAQTANVLIMKQKVPFLVLKKALRRAGFFYALRIDSLVFEI